MIIDSSAILAILSNEAEANEFVDVIVNADSCRMSAANFFETAIVVDAKGDADASRQLDFFIRRAGIEIEAVTYEQTLIARQAYLDFGKGRHPASLNFGDCFAYALSRETGEPLLCKGNDFIKTDIVVYKVVNKGN